MNPLRLLNSAEAGPNLPPNSPPSVSELDAEGASRRAADAVLENSSDPMNENFPKAHLETLWAPLAGGVLSDQITRLVPTFFTEAAQAQDDAAHFVVARGKLTFLIMNKYPYSAGHLMAVTHRKVSDMADLTDGEVLELWQLCIRAQKLLKETVKAQGFNIGWNSRPEPPGRRRRSSPPAYRAALAGRRQFHDRHRRSPHYSRGTKTVAD